MILDGRNCLKAEDIRSQVFCIQVLEESTWYFNMYEAITDRKIRMAIVGCGRIAKGHFGSIEKHANDIELSAICDVNADVLEKHREKYQVPAYRSLEVMLEQKTWIL